ncbi:Salicylate 1-monooxygenase [Purpureocillium takamizusanense]|uniref:Salicylate 1-monooxygenase n=1 Tax=Purpureocillium takamizusanense TaxID=2060973 RepID=A0A9Q8QMR2_9HYPO|nr:Salicylate 1-monooxygenase [Purpureocillium takamizusanense]UNI21292.1 Salicylate 1-monooxygenase [Purpureocillium takamizusanense]
MLNVLVVGAGISGLCAAISLRRAGHCVHVYERSALNSEIGAAINIPPNASRFLLAWGLDPARWRFAPSRRVSYLDPFTLQPLDIVFREDGPQAFGGCDLFYAHRVDLHSALKWMAIREDGPGTPATIHLQAKVVGFVSHHPMLLSGSRSDLEAQSTLTAVRKQNSDKPSICLDGGQEVTGDVVIAADGVHSVASDVVLGYKNLPVPPVYSNACYRFLIPLSDLEEDPDTRFLNEDCHGWARLIPHVPTNRRIVTYPCRKYGRLPLNKNPQLDWQASVDISQVLERFSDYHPGILRVISKAKEVKQYPLLYRHPLPAMYKGRMALAGDAAHPMLPHHGQGGAQGLEDGLALGIVLHGASSPADIESRLEIYDRVRRRRASAIQILSNAGLEQSEFVQRELCQYMDPDEIPKTMDETYKYSFGFDVVRETLKAMRQRNPDFRLPEDFFESEVAAVPGQ